MTDGYDFDGDDGFGFEDNWLYVEDEFDLADELAETQTAEPGYPGTNYQVEMETYDYEMYEFWDDMEYADDEYWDYGANSVIKEDSGETAQKRKRNAQNKAAHPDKKRKLTGGQAPIRKTETEGNFPVYYLSTHEQLCVAQRRPPLLQDRRPVAFLADWRERFPESEDVMMVEMPEDMQRAAEAGDENATLREALAGGYLDLHQGNDDAWEEEEEAEAWDDDGRNGNALVSLDMNTLKTVLRQKMADAGLEGVGEEELMSTISKMLNGEGDSDEATGDLASALLEQETQGDGTAFADWLSQQGVSLQDGEDDTISVASREQEPEPAKSSDNGPTRSAALTTNSAQEEQASDIGRSRKTVKGVEVSTPPNRNGDEPEGTHEADPLIPFSDMTVTNVPRSKSTKSTYAAREQTSVERIVVVDEESKPRATRLSRKRKAPANEPNEAETNAAVPQAIKEPAPKRTRGSKARPGV